MSIVLYKWIDFEVSNTLVVIGINIVSGQLAEPTTRLQETWQWGQERAKRERSKAIKVMSMIHGRGSCSFLGQ